MKKVLICLLSVLLTLCLFVSCSSSPEKDNKTIKLNVKDVVSTNPDITIELNIGGATHFGEELLGATINYYGQTYTYKEINTVGYGFEADPLVIIVYYDISDENNPVICGNDTIIEERTYQCRFFCYNS